ncbi:hypothetical protein [Xanthomonas sacchari]|uniref:hypothetical protein n=1 Tax=Xanthomonas sacchari TaxID=56458 RepID=UPI0020C41912|nr:hypothetical protein [Xanthomonas sacchari]
MSNLIQGITFSLFSAKSNFEREMVSKIIEELLGAPEEIRPRSFGFFSGDKPIRESAEVLDLIFKKSQVQPDAISLVLEFGGGGYQLQWNKTEPPEFCFIGGTLRNNLISSKPGALDCFIDLFKGLATIFDVSYGEIRSMAVKNWDNPVDLWKRLPDIPSISIYGKDYIDMFGRCRIESAPFLKVKILSEELYVLYAADDVVSPVDEKTKDQIRAHLGEDSFMSGGKWRYKDGVHPHFNFS